jgi:hypothetical protein
MDAGRRPIRESPLLEGSKLARLLRDLVSQDCRLSRYASCTLRHRAWKGEDISELFPAIRQVLASGNPDPDTVRHLLWAAKYAREHGADISSLQPAIDSLRRSQDGETRSMAGWFRGGPSA